MVRIIRTHEENPHFMALVRELDADLAKRDGDEHPFYAQFNKLHLIKHVVLAYADEIPVGCGAMKEYADTIMEIKRMYTIPAMRGKGIAGRVLHELESWASLLGYSSCILETGLQQPEAIALYNRSGYKQIPNYGQYAGITNSVCFEKELHEKTLN